MVQPTDPLSGCTTFYSEDLDQITETSKNIDGFQRRTVLDRGPLSYRFNYAFLQKTAVSWSRCNRDMEIDVQGMESSFVIHFCQSGLSSYRWPFTAADSQNHCAVIVSPGYDVKLRHRDVSSYSLRIDREFLEEEFRNRLCAPLADPLFFEPVVHLDSPTGLTLQRMFRFMLAELEQPDSTFLKSSLALEHFEKCLVNVLLSGQEHNYSGRFEQGCGEDCSNQGRIGKVEDFIDRHYAESLSVDVLARVAGVGVRSLQKSFRRHRSTSPMAYLQFRRLMEARRILLAPNQGTSVTEAALSVGFPSLSRFSGIYKETFGEMPSQTLTRGRRTLGLDKKQK